MARGPPFSAQRAIRSRVVLDLDGGLLAGVLVDRRYYLLGEAEAKARTTFE